MALFVSSAMKGQERVGTFSLIPKIGVSLANLSGEEIYYNNAEIPAKGKYNARFVGGVEAVYQMLPMLTLSLATPRPFRRVGTMFAPGWTISSVRSPSTSI